MPPRLARKTQDAPFARRVLPASAAITVGPSAARNVPPDGRASRDGGMARGGAWGRHLIALSAEMPAASVP